MVMSILLKMAKKNVISGIPFGVTKWGSEA